MIIMNDADKTVVIAAQIIAAEARTESMKEASLEDRLRSAMRAGHNFWMSTDEDVRFRGSVAAVLLHCSEDERERIGEELKMLRDLSALLSGVPVDTERITAAENPIGLMRLWREDDAAEAITTPS